MGKIIYYLKQLLPLICYSRYEDDKGNKYFHIWNMWFGKVFNQIKFPISIKEEIESITTKTI